MAGSLLLSACAGGGGETPTPRPASGPEGLDPPPAEQVRSVAPGLEIRPLAPGVWLHTTWRELEGTGPFPSHGLVVQDADGLLLVDAAWGDEETVALVEWLERELGRPVTRMLATHHHDDRLSGSAFLQGRGTPVLAHPLTTALAAEDGVLPPTPLTALARTGSSTRLGPVEVFYPGPGHAADNLVVWVTGTGVLFGGCAVRPGGTASLGNVADADLESWPEAIERVRARYGPRTRLVVPGHGPPGGPELLGHTTELLAAPGAR